MCVACNICKDCPNNECRDFKHPSGLGKGVRGAPRDVKKDEIAVELRKKVHSADLNDDKLLEQAGLELAFKEDVAPFPNEAFAFALPKQLCVLKSAVSLENMGESLHKCIVKTGQEIVKDFVSKVCLDAKSIDEITPEIVLPLVENNGLAAEGVAERLARSFMLSVDKLRQREHFAHLAGGAQGANSSEFLKTVLLNVQQSILADDALMEEASARFASKFARKFAKTPGLNAINFLKQRLERCVQWPKKRGRIACAIKDLEILNRGLELEKTMNKSRVKPERIRHVLNFILNQSKGA